MKLKLIAKVLKLTVSAQLISKALKYDQQGYHNLLLPIYKVVQADQQNF